MKEKNWQLIWNIGSGTDRVVNMVGTPWCSKRGKYFIAN